jgi:hypothetical protein
MQNLKNKKQYNLTRHITLKLPQKHKPQKTRVSKSWH